MNNKIACLLCVCLYPTNITSNTSENRMKQYENGFRKFFEYNFTEKNIDVYIIDNSIKSIENIPPNILNTVPNNVTFICHTNNQYGCKNKGAGLIENWLVCKEVLKQYDWIIHFEPRQLLKNFDFFDSFFKNPRNLFTMGKENNHFNTGLFCIQTNILLNYISTVNLQEMVFKYISIEYDIYDFFIKNNIYYDLENKMNLIWYATEKLIFDM